MLDQISTSNRRLPPAAISQQGMPILQDIDWAVRVSVDTAQGQRHDLHKSWWVLRGLHARRVDYPTLHIALAAPQ